MDRADWAEAAFAVFDRQAQRDEAAALAAEEALERRVAELMDEVACSDLEATVTNPIGRAVRDCQPVDEIAAEYMCLVDDSDECPEHYLRMAMVTAAAAFSAARHHGPLAAAESHRRAGIYLTKAIELACFRKAEEEAAR